MAKPRTTSEDYSRPYRSAPVKVFNQLSRTLRASGTLASAQELMAQAQKKTGLSDFGDEVLVEPLEQMIAAINAEAKLSPFGLVGIRARLANILSQRLRAEEMFRLHPEILEIKIEAPIFIVGLQRSGTTLLHRLLAADPGLRALISWEAANPVPVPKRFWHRQDPRIATGVMAQRIFRYMAPDFFAVHSIDAMSPEEEILLLDFTFLCTISEAMYHIPSFTRWLETQDQTPAYRYFKKLLQLLLWQAPADRWILKTPHHLEWLDTLFKVFPDAKIVQIHRDPQKTMPSFCSMIGHLWGAFSDHVDPHEIGRELSRKLERMVTRGMEARDRIGEERFFDMSYYDLVDDPIQQIESIYKFVERPFTEEIKACIAKELGKNEKHKHGIHRYHLDDFGLNKVGLERIFASYRSRFNVPHED
jgi:hypothetical protein